MQRVIYVRVHGNTAQGEGYSVNFPPTLSSLNEIVKVFNSHFEDYQDARKGHLSKNAPIPLVYRGGNTAAFIPRRFCNG